MYINSCCLSGFSMSNNGSSAKIESIKQLNTDIEMPETLPKNPLSEAPIKALIFDLMGTCLDWHSTVSPILKEAVSSSNEIGSRSPNALSWRHRFFNEIHSRFEAGLPQEDIDETHRRTLLALLRGEGWTMDDDKVEACVRAWHSQKGNFISDRLNGLCHTRDRTEHYQHGQT
jgi:hypothetical protein